MKTKAYRDYYERLARARKKLRKELLEKVKTHSFWSVTYRDSFKKILYEMIAKRMVSAESPAILDVGCGIGFDLAHLAKIYRFRGFGIDLSITCLKVASSNDSLKKCKFVQADVQRLPFKDSTFDMVICSELIEHLPEPESCLEGILRMLKKDGFLFLTTPNRWDYFHTLGQLIPKPLRKQMVKILQGEAVDVDSDEYITEQGIVEHIYLFTVREIKSHLQNMGFSIEEVKGGRLAVPFPRVFDHCSFLQHLWSGLDKAISLFAFSKYLKTAILLVGRKN